nr:hypothetical protein [Candidatus Cyanaurora vandensis]
MQGTNFQGTTKVTFGYVDATSFTITSGTILKAVVAPGTPTGAIRVINTAGSATSGTNFAVLTSPVITTINPTLGGTGTAVVINGSGFSGTTTVNFNGVADPTFIVDSALKIRATAPVGATTGKITVTNPVATATSPTDFVISAPPTISSFTPIAGPVGGVVTITGTNFTGTNRVSFGYVDAMSFTVVSDSEIRATVANGTPTGAIRLTTPGGTATSATGFTILVAPTVSTLNPSSGRVGSSVTVTGSGFTGTTAVQFNGVAASSFVIDSATRIRAIVSPGATPGPVTVMNAAGTGTSLTSFQVIP